MNDTIIKTERLQKKRIWLATIPAIVMCVLVWVSFLIDYTRIFHFNFSMLGIYPRQLNGLTGIIFSSFVHGSFSHLVSNTVPLLILISLLFYFYNQIAFKSLALLWLLSGFLTWLIGRNSYHVGASGLIFALVFFCFSVVCSEIYSACGGIHDSGFCLWKYCVEHFPDNRVC